MKGQFPSPLLLVYSIIPGNMAHAELRHCWCLFDIGLSLQFGEPMMHS
jgi:hypothetical protein